MPRRRPAIRRAGATLVASLLCSLLPVAALAASGEDQLRQAIVADDSVSYTGTITTLVYTTHGANATVVRVDHRAPKKWRMWYVAPADAYGRLIVSNESLTYQYEPKIATVFSNDWAQTSPDVILELDAQRVLKNYSVDVGAATNIAGRKATALSLISKHTGALAERLWVDAENKLLLQRETYRSDGTVESKTTFEDIRFVKDLPDGLFDLTVPTGMHVQPGATFGKARKDIATIQSSLNFTIISPSDLPEGFTLERASLGTPGGVPTAELLYTDGLRDFSLFENSTDRLPQVTASRDIDIDDSSGVTADIAGETLVSWNAGGLNITLVGDLSAKELAKIGASVKP